MHAVSHTTLCVGGVCEDDNMGDRDGSSQSTSIVAVPPCIVVTLQVPEYAGFYPAYEYTDIIGGIGVINY